LFKIFEGVENQKVEFRQGKERYQIEITFGKEKHILLKGANADLEYPDFNFFEMEERTITIPKDNLWFAQMAMSNDETRNNLNGICAVEGIGVCATDGHRMHIVSAEMTEFGKIYPANFVDEMIRIAKFTKSQISFACRKADKELNRDIGYFSVEDYKTKWTLYSQMVDSVYPDVKMVLPEHSKIEILIEPKETTKTLKRIKKFCSKADEKGESMVPCVKLKVSNDKVIFCANRYDEIVTEIEIDVTTLKPGNEEFLIGLNVNYFIDILQKEAEKVKVTFDDDLSPIKFIRSDGSYGVIMPMRI